MWGAGTVTRLASKQKVRQERPTAIAVAKTKPAPAADSVPVRVDQEPNLLKTTENKHTLNRKTMPKDTTLSVLL